MERRLNKKFELYISEFKDKIKGKVAGLEFTEKEKMNDLLEFVYEYERLVFQKEDVSKRKRIKNSIPVTNRCNAKRANGEQCTRRRKDNCEYCGTHVKGTPHGLITNETDTNSVSCTVEVFAQEIGGIVYYIDKHTNVYKTEDVLQNKENPSIVANYAVSNDVYHIPAFGI
jgi:hypothetical protein